MPKTFININEDSPKSVLALVEITHQILTLRDRLFYCKKDNRELKQRMKSYIIALKKENKRLGEVNLSLLMNNADLTGNIKTRDDTILKQTQVVESCMDCIKSLREEYEELKFRMEGLEK